VLARRRWFSLAFLTCAIVLPGVARAQGPCRKPSPTGVTRADTLKAFQTWVTPADSSIWRPEHSAGNTVTFRIGNTGDCDDWAYLSAWGDGTVGIDGQVDSVRPDALYLPAGFAGNATVYFSMGGQPGGGLYLESSGGGRGSYTVTAVAPPPGNGPVLDLVHSYIGTNHDVTRCVANCFDAVMGYSTPAYYSTDAPQSVKLVYRSSAAYPRGFVNVFAYDTTTVHPTRMSVQLKRPNGSSVAFVNGSTEMFFSCDSTGGHSYCSAASYAWLAVQYDVSSDTTGAYALTLIVRSYRPDSTFRETTSDLMTLVNNESASPFGTGWMIAGYQRLHVGPGNSFFITEGNGSIAYFPKTMGASTWSSPPGDFSTLDCCNKDTLGANTRRRYPDGTTVGFLRTDGQIAYIQDSHGNTHQWRYNASNQLAAIRDVAGKEDSLGYVNGKLRWIKDPGGRVDSITIDGSNNLIRIKDAAGGVPFQGTYDNHNRLVHRSDRGSGTWGLAYDFANKLASDTTPAIKVHATTLRLFTRYISLETALLGDTTHGSWTSPSPALTSFTAHATVFNPKGYATTYVLDRFRQAAGITEPLGRYTGAGYDSLGRRTSYTPPGGQGHSIRYTWDGPNIVQTKDTTLGHASRTIHYVYDGTYNLLKLTWGDVDSVINVLNNGSDGAAANSRVDSTRVGGATVWSEFNYVSSPHWYHHCTVTGVSTSYRATCTYPRSTEFRNTDSVATWGIPNLIPAAATTVYQYDGHGQRIRTVNPRGDTTWTQYDSLGRVKQAIGPLFDTTTYVYDSLYLTQIRDAKGHVHRVWPNALGWPDSTRDPAGGVTHFYYDVNGNRDSVVNRRNQRFTFAYDSLDQLRKRVVGSDTTTYFTDPLGRFSWGANRESVDTVKMDSTGRPAVEISCRVLVVGDSAACFVDSSRYDEAKNLRASLTLISPGELWGPQTASYHYNPYFLLDTLTNFVGQAEAFTYNGELRDSTRTFLALNNLTLTYGRPADVVNTSGSSHSPFIPNWASLSFSDTALTRQMGSAYTFDTLSRVAKHHHGQPATPDTVRAAGLDAAGRLIQYIDRSYRWSSSACSLGMLGEACDSSKITSSDTVAMETYVYDAVGNRIDSLTQGYAGTDAANRLLRWKNFRMTYDADGNLTAKRVLNVADTAKTDHTDSLFWSPTGLLDSLKRADSLGAHAFTITYGYDAWGRRVRYSWNCCGPWSTQLYLWDGHQMAARLGSDGALMNTWTFYPGSDEPQSTGSSYYVTDGLHNVVGVIRSTGGGTYSLYQQARYRPFGDGTTLSGSAYYDMLLYFKGAHHDPNGDLYLMGARYYDPDVGRFISEDPIGLKDGVNLYTFGGNDPINGYDPSGDTPLQHLAISVLLRLIPVIWSTIPGADVLAFAIGLGLAHEAADRDWGRFFHGLLDFATFLPGPLSLVGSLGRAATDEVVGTFVSGLAAGYGTGVWYEAAQRSPRIASSNGLPTDSSKAGPCSMAGSDPCGAGNPLSSYPGLPGFDISSLRPSSEAEAALVAKRWWAH